MGDEIGAASLRAFARALSALWAHTEGPLLLGHDTRPLGSTLVEIVAAEWEGRVARLASPVATPVLTWALARGKGCGGVQITASHNPASDQGLKIFSRVGVGLDPGEAETLRRLARRWLRRGSTRAPKRRPGRRPWEADTEYGRALAALLDFDGRPPGLVYDSLYGAGGGLLARVLAGTGCRVIPLHSELDPRFGGVAPDPRPSSLASLRRICRAQSMVGLATDGDADRFALVAESGTLCSEDEALALLIDHVARVRGERGAVALSRGVGTLPERVAREHGLDVIRTPVGFRYSARLLASRRAALAGDESGGVAWRAFSHDKDGLLACGLLAEVAARAGGIRRARRALRRRAGPLRWARQSLRATASRRRRLETLTAEPPDRVAGTPVRSRLREDGLYVGLGDGFLMLRAAQTEGLIRVYAEAPSAPELRRRLAAAAALLDGARRSR